MRGRYRVAEVEYTSPKRVLWTRDTVMLPAVHLPESHPAMRTDRFPAVEKCPFRPDYFMCKIWKPEKVGHTVMCPEI